ncbi:MAG TPA: ATP-binding domain-containing protein [Acidimicrobiales bacterium]|nr:ATP-binding domain-containing protein [Acidimicrobiales bacterium]
MSTDRDFASEQDYIRAAYDHLDTMRRRAESLVGQSEDPDLEAALTRRVNLLTDNGRPLCFGRIDAENGERWYIGRRHVEDRAADPVVVEWRAPVAVPFYRAGLADPMGLTRRRQFVADRATLLSMADDLFGPEAASTDPRVRGRDALLAELERERTGEMLDIVATIQAEQDEVIRAPLEGVLAVQGGPGTGKTAIGLHRAAYLLYAHPELARSGVLVIGPNRTFLRYIALVLPSLGEEAVIQTTLPDLVPEIRVRAAETDGAVARLKGDARLAAVLARAVDDCRRPPDDDLELSYGVTRVHIPAADVADLVASLAARRAPYNSGRSSLRDRLASLAYRRYAESTGRMHAVDHGTAVRDIKTDPSFRTAVDAVWPAVGPAALVRDLLTSPARMARAADGLLTPDEQALLLRSPARRMTQEPWTEADAPLVDEARELLSGRTRTYGHVVVDEAQDLSPMQLRMLARRAPAGSVTVLGDLAQGTGVWAHDTWDEVVDVLPTPKGRRHAELSLGYRCPGRVLELASRLLPVAAPSIRPTESIREGRTRPLVIRAPGPGDVMALAVEEAARCAEEHGSVGLIVPAAAHDGAARALSGAGIGYADASDGQLGRMVSLVPAPTSKGLEFDAVVVVEPAAIVDDAPRGLRLLYVAMTRPTKHLSLVHHRPLPGMFAA